MVFRLAGQPACLHHAALWSWPCSPHCSAPFPPRPKWSTRASSGCATPPAGLFLHWGMFTAPRHTDCAAWERDVCAAAGTPTTGSTRRRSCTPPTSCSPPSTKPARVRAAVALGDPRQLLHATRLPRRIGCRRQGQGRPGVAVHDRRPAVAQRSTGGSDARLRRLLGVQGAAGRPDHPGRLRNVQLRPVPRGDGRLSGPVGVLDRQRQRLLGTARAVRADPGAEALVVAEQQQRGHPDHGHRQQRAEDRDHAGLRLPTGHLHADAPADRGRLQAADHGPVVVRRQRQRGRLRAQRRPVRRQCGVVDQVADGRDRDGQRQVPAEPGEVQQLHGRAGCRRCGRR